MQALTGLNILLATFDNAVDTLSQNGIARFLMRGNDILKGSAGDQDLIGYGGNDSAVLATTSSAAAKARIPMTAMAVSIRSISMTRIIRLRPDQHQHRLTTDERIRAHASED